MVPYRVNPALVLLAVLALSGCLQETDATGASLEGAQEEVPFGSETFAGTDAFTQIGVCDPGGGGCYGFTDRIDAEFKAETVRPESGTVVISWESLVPLHTLRAAVWSGNGNVLARGEGVSPITIGLDSLGGLRGPYWIGVIGGEGPAANVEQEVHWEAVLVGPVVE